MRLIAKKPCSFNGQVFYIGDEIPSEFVINPKAQEKLGVIAIAAGGEMYAESPSPDERVGQVEFAVPIKQKDGDETMHFTEEQISKAAEVMQMTTAYAKDAIKEISDEKTLILINACDSRKAIKEATEEAASKLFDGEANRQGESEGDE